MTVRSFKSSTSFDKSLELLITETDDGRKTTSAYSGFRTLKEAEDFVEWWEDLYSWGYMGSASVSSDLVVHTSRYNSCD
jgi:hypothetical protein